MTQSRNASQVCAQSSDTPRAVRVLRELLGLFVASILISALLTFLAVQFRANPGTAFIVAVFAVNFTFSMCIGGSLSLLYTFLFPRLYREGQSRTRKFLSHVAVLLPGCIIGVELTLLILDLQPWAEVRIPRFGAYQVALAIGTVIVVIITTYEELRARARRSEVAAEQARREALNAQLEALQARTNPHFLFNSLNTVAGLIEEDPKKAEQVLERFSDLLRYSLTGGRRERVALREELDVVRGYLEVEGFRLGERLSADLRVQDGIEELQVPPLVLQPLVENAVLHGIAPRREGGRVEIRVERLNGALELSVEDDGPGPGRSVHEGTGTGLTGLRDRLRILYGDEATVETGTATAGGFRVRVRLPLEPVSVERSEAADEHAGEAAASEPTRRPEEPGRAAPGMIPPPDAAGEVTP